MRLVFATIISLLFVATASAQYLYTANIYDRTYYCESKDGYEITYGDVDRITGLAHGRTFSWEFVDMRRDWFDKEYCKSLFDYLFD